MPPRDASADEVRRSLERLRRQGEQLRRRPPQAIIEALGALLERLRDPTTPERRRLEAELPAATGFSAAAVREGLSLALADWTAPALEALVRAELGSALGVGGPRRAVGFPVTAVLLAGALPTPTLAAILAPLLLRSPVLLKPSVHDPVTPHVVAEALAALDPELGGCVAVASFRGTDEKPLEAFLEAECVVATGSDETVGKIARRVSPPQRLVVYGHRLSVAVIGSGAGRGAGLEQAARALALDVALWDQLGCLSPVAAWLHAPSGRIAAEQLEVFANAFSDTARQIPRGRLEPAAAAAVADARASAELREAAGQAVALRAGDGFTLVAEDTAAFRESPLHRFIRLHPFRDPNELAAALQPLAPHLAAVGVAGVQEPANAPLRETLVRLGASRICPLGRMQAPPLGWCHDGQGVLLPLARLTDVEIGAPSS